MELFVVELEKQGLFGKSRRRLIVHCENRAAVEAMVHVHNETRVSGLAPPEEWKIALTHQLGGPVVIEGSGLTCSSLDRLGYALHADADMRWPR